MAALLGARSGLPDFFTGADSRPNPVVAAFEKELGCFIASLKRVEKRATDAQSRQKAFNTLFTLWNSYEGRLATSYFTQQLLATGDALCQAKEYALAQTHCYGRCLGSLGLRHQEEGRVEEYFQGVEDAATITAALRALIGDAMCQFYLTEREDPGLMHDPSRKTAQSVLRRLQLSTQVSLQREPLYWLLYNAIVLTYSVCRKVMALGYSGPMVVEHLLWAAVCMESSVPLMAVRHLRLRVGLYVAVCQCYYDLKQPVQAELFAREHLTKVTELARMEFESSSEATESSERVFREVSVKLEVMIFRQSVFETRKKLKSLFRPKIRPTVKELLLLQTSPSSPFRFQTEKLLSEMFQGHAAQFLAVLESLVDTHRRPLEQVMPTATAGLDLETTTDVYQELFCMGTDLAQKALDQLCVGSGSLMAAASQGADDIPLQALVRFVHLAYSHKQQEVFTMLAERVTQAAMSSEVAQVRAKGKSLQLLLAVEALRNDLKRQKTAAEDSKPVGEENSSEEPLDRVLQLLQLLRAACCCCCRDVNAPREPEAEAESLVSSEYDLLLDTALYVWEVARPALARIHSHEWAACRHLLMNDTGQQYVMILEQLLEVFHVLELWRVDPLLHGELGYKLACLQEARADLKHATAASQLIGDAAFILYDRRQLLECLSVLQAGLKCVSQAREAKYRDQSLHHSGEKITELEVLHADLLFALTRVQIKLASTIPPPPPPEGTQKPSSLRSKVRERRERLEQRERLLSVLTAPEAQVGDEAALLQSCGKDRYLAALLAMQRAVVTPQLEQASREVLLEEAFVHLSQLSQEQRADPNTTAASSSPPPSTTTPPPPVLLHATNTSMAFAPAPFQPNSGQKISYYQLSGRPFTGSNIKVRLGDKQLPGLGVEVPAGKGCVLEVCGLQPNEEYVFAVAAYTSRGELVGGAIGQTSRPHLANFPLPLPAAWGYCCQCAYTAGVPSVARQAAQVLWKNFTVPTNVGDASDGDQQELQLYQLSDVSSTPAAIVRQFVQSVLIHTQLVSAEGSLLPSQLCVGGPLRASQKMRIELTRRLLAALEVAGMLNDASLVLQAVVMCYGLLVPLIQHSIAAMPVVQVLLHCHAALSQLADLPESPLVCKHTDTTASLHHMIATTAYHAGKVLLSWHKKAVFSSLMDNASRLLLLTMPSLTGPGTKATKDGPTGGSGLHQSSLLSGALGDPSLSSYTTMSSILPGLLTQQKAGKKKKKARRKVTTAAEQLSDEAKSMEYKSFEAFLKASQGQSALEGVDITGQEDPVILHAVIAAMQPQAAYKEVHKFRRRPQYLEFFVHLASATVAKGQPERVLEWGQEAFSWLARRNELLLKPQPAPPQKPAAPQRMKASKSGPPSATGFSTALQPVKQTDSVASLQQGAAPLPRGSRGKLGAGKLQTISEKKLGAMSSQATLSKKKHQPISSQMVPVKRAGKLQLSLAPEVNRDNIESKAKAILQSLLPEMWRNHKCRKRLSLVSREELPWRVQANLLLGGCHLRALLQELQTRAKTGAPAMPGWDKGEGNYVTLVPAEWLRFESAGFLINGVIPIHDDSLPGTTRKKRGEDVSRERGMAEGEGLADNYRQQTPLQELQQMMACLQRAVVLAHRGNSWILLQNSCRVLWNAMSTLVNTLTQHLNSPPAQEDCAGISLAAVYGLACKPLYFAASGLTDLLLQCGSHNASSPLPTSTSLHFTPVLDDCNTLDWLSARRLVLLAVHTLYAHQHWEKMIDVATKFDDVTNHSWAQQLVPVIKSAQEKLAERMQIHKGTLARKALDPAAHLDPGPEGHDVYGGVGHALALASVPLDTRATMSRLGQGDRGGYSAGGERVLLHSRGMMIQYLAGASGHFRTEDPPDLPMSLSTKDLPSTPGSIPLVSQSSIQLSSVITAYDGAARQLLSMGERDLAAQSMHELGNLLYHSSSAKSASHWWSEALQTILQTTDPLNSWRGLVAPTKAVEMPLEGCGVWGRVVGGMLAAKLAKYIYRNELDIQLEYTLMATALFKSLLASSLPHPLSELDYLSYQLEPGGRLLPGVELFADRFRCDPITLLSCLQFYAQQLVSRNHSLKVQPVLWLYEHIAHTVCRDVQHTVTAKVLKLRTLTHLSLFAEAISLLMEIVSGAKLPQTSFEYDRLPDSHVATAKFSNNLPLINSKNMKALATVFERTLSPSLEAVYGETAVSRLALARAELYVAMAATSTPIPQQTILKRADQSSTRPSTALSTISAPSSTVSGRSDSTVPGAKPYGKVRAPTTPSHVKSQLLDHSERLLVDLCRDLHDPGMPFSLELRTRAYLSLAEVALTQHHSSTAIQLSLAAMRLLQGASSAARQSVVNDGLLGTRLWLECRAMLARSLVGSQPVEKSQLLESGSAGLLDCSEQCREGLRECEACGEVELSAQLHSTSAWHAMTRDPPDLEAVTVHAQTALQLLESLADLSPRARLLQSHTSILLADATCVLGGEGGRVEEEMVKVFRGLGALLKEQLTQESPREQSENIYKPHLALFASSKLRLAHTFALLATQHADRGKKQEYHSLVQKACEEGIETLKTSAFSDPCLMTELLFYKEWLQSTSLINTPEGSQVHLDSTALLEARTAVADCGVDYRLAFTCYSELAQMFVVSSKQSNPFQHSEETCTGTITATPLEQTSRASQASSKASSKVQEQEQKSKAEKEWLKERTREAFFAWCSIRTAQHIVGITQGLHRLTAEIRNEEVAKLLPDKAIMNMPDFALLEICRPHDVTNVLVTSVESVPVDVLAPSAQVVDTIGLSWFKVLAYTHTLLQKCFWQKSSLPDTNSWWSLHYHCLTPIFYQRSRAMLDFLAVHFPPFSSLRIPPPVSALPSISATQKSTLSFQPAPGQQSVVPPLSPAAEPGHLSAGDAELNVIWMKPFVCAESAEETDATSPILGLFAMNQKAIKITSTTAINFKAMNVNVLLVKTTVPALLELYNTWEELAVAAKDYLDTKATSRPISRSPSKQKKSDQSLKPPSELQAKVLQAVQKLCDTFGLEFMEDQLPRLEPHSVAGISKVLQPFANTTVRGDTYYFFKTLLS